MSSTKSRNTARTHSIDQYRVPKYLKYKQYPDYRAPIYFNCMKYLQYQTPKYCEYGQYSQYRGPKYCDYSQYPRYIIPKYCQYTKYLSTFSPKYFTPVCILRASVKSCKTSLATAVQHRKCISGTVQVLATYHRQIRY